MGLVNATLIMSEKHTHITKDFVRSGGGNEGTRVYTITSINDGKTEVVLERTISERYPVQKLNEVLDMAKDMDAGGGRRMVFIEDLLDVYKHRKVIVKKKY